MCAGKRTWTCISWSGGGDRISLCLKQTRGSRAGEKADPVSETHLEPSQKREIKEIGNGG